MNDEMIAPCGLDCGKCDARKATITNDDALREKTAKLWCEWNHTDEIKPEHINCLGCLAEGVKTYYCSELCGIRKCCLSKGYTSCASCAEKKTCATLAPLVGNNEEAKKNIGI